MAEKITYILGAGASIGSFPLVKGSQHHKQHNGLGLADTLANEGHSLLHKFPMNMMAKTISEAMMDIGVRAKAFGNIDSYAKYLFLTKQPFVLSSLKMALAYYFIRQQVCEAYYSLKTETRYLNFITSLITKEFQFPNHVKILNWNYDFLLGLASMEYVPEVFKEEGGTVIKAAVPFIKYIPSIGIPVRDKRVPVDNNYSIIYLNGIAGYFGDVDPHEHGFFKNVIVELLDGDIKRKITEEELLAKFDVKFAKFHSLITFAWEGELEDNFFLGNRLRNAISMAKDTNILVVIGYSFPFYNREFDNAIFTAMKPTLKKIYFQDPYVDGSFLKKRYDLQFVPENGGRPGFGNTPASMRKPFEIEHITETDQFYIPIEV